MKISIKIGDTFGKLKVVNEADKKILPCGQKIRVISCICECGSHKEVLLVHLVRGKVVSCGCAYKTKNGESNSKLHRKYKAMIERCQSNSIKKHIYFDRGIKVCDEWIKDYFVFKKWAISKGYKEGLTIDRADNSKGYNPANCRFVTPKQNSNNRRCTTLIKYKNTSYPIMELFDKLNIQEHNRAAIRGRINRGWNHDLAFDKPIKKGNYRANPH